MKKNKSPGISEKKTALRHVGRRCLASPKTGREIEEKYQTILDNIEDSYYEVDLEGNFTFFNNSLCQLGGCSREELMGTNHRQFLNEETARDVFQMFNKVYTTGTPAKAFDWKMIRKDGAIRYVEASASLIKEASGKPVGFRGIIRDVTERKKIEEKLRNEEHLFRTLAEQSSDMIVLVNRKGMITYENPAIEKILGFNVDDRIGASLFDLIHTEDLKCITDAALTLAKDRSADRLHTELRLRDREGNWRTFEVTATNIVHDKLIEGGLINLRDITRRKESERELKESEAKYRLLADHTKDQIWLMDLNFKIFYASPSVEKLWGYTLEELNHLAWDKVLLPETLARIMDLVTQVTPITMDSLDNILERSVELEMRCKDGRTVWEEVVCSFIRDENGKAVAILGQGREITERKQMEEALKKGEGRYRSVFENAGLPMVIMEDSLLIFMVNDRFVEMSGYAKDEMEGLMKFADFIAVGDRGALMQCFSRRKDDKPVEYECQIAHRDGRKFDVLIRLGHIPGANQFIASFTDITARKEAEQALLENQEYLQKENIRLRSSIRERYRFCDIIGKSQAMQDVYEFILQAAETQANVIIYGESGTGKELVAKAIHETSDRSQRGFVTVNCGAIPETLMESEFFGYKKGAFTGANVDRRGYLDEADSGTLFLDEVGEIGMNMQVKLLRAIAGDGYTPVGGNTIKNADVRIVAATNRNLRELVRRGMMREDFFYRIHILPIYLPPLRARKEDLPLLVDHFLDLFDKNHPPLPGHILEALLNYDWPGNIRELQSVLYRYLTLKRLDFAGVPQLVKEPYEKLSAKVDDSGSITAAGDGDESPDQFAAGGDDRSLENSLKSIEREHILKALSENNWHRGQTASALGINRKTLFLKMQKFGLTRKLL